MSLLHPGGFRGRMGMFDGRIFGADNIRRAIIDNMKARDHARKASTSIATGKRDRERDKRSWLGWRSPVVPRLPHEHKREISRRVRQAAARAR